MVLTGDYIVFADFAGKGDGFGKIGGDGTDKIKLFWETVFVDEGAVGGHLHTGIDSNEVSKLTGEGGRHTFDAIRQV